MSERKVNREISRDCTFPAEKPLPMTRVDLKLNDELYDLVAAEADRRGMSLAEVVVERLSHSFGRKDLNTIPRKKLGRPRKDRVPA